MEQMSEQIRRKWAIEDKRQFCKQSCTKIDQGLAKLDNRSSERAIWELFQNARDLAKTNANGEKIAYIKIQLTADEFIFSHQGKPFTHDSFSSLVKQVSSHEKEDNDSVGQYGTGFLTTHAFGKKIKIVGSLDMEDAAPGKFVNIDDFIIDRTYDDIPQFIEKMANQLLKIDSFADAEQVEYCREWTELHYQLDSAEGAALKAKDGIRAAIKVMPYVMTINSSLLDVVIIDENNTISFSKSVLPDENSLKVMSIEVNENGDLFYKKIYYLQSDDCLDIVILPLKDSNSGESLANIAKLFVYFPLLGTESFGMDFIFHSHRFYPVEERDAIHLPVENENVKNKYNQNVRVLNEMTDMLFKYLGTHSNQISNWVDISELCFECERNKENVTNNFFYEFKRKWVNFYVNIPMIEIDNDMQSISSGCVKFFSKEIVQNLEGDLSCWLTDVYNVVAGLSVPNKANILKWSKVLHSWLPSDHNCFLSVRKIAEMISKNGMQNLDILHGFDMFVKESSNVALFDTFPLIPNREGILTKKSQLFDAIAIPDWLYNISKKLVEEKTSKFVHEHFSDIINISSFSRNDLRSAINDVLTTMRRNSLDNFCPQMYNREILKILAQLSAIYRQENATTFRNAVLPHIFKHLGFEYSECILPPLDSDEKDISELPFKHLVENILLEISMMGAAEIIENIDYVYSIHKALSPWGVYYDRNNNDGYAVKYGAFPNQMYNPCKVSELKKAVSIPPEMAELYNSVFGINIKEELVDDRFADFYDFEILDADLLAKRIEDKLAEDNFKSKFVLDIINNLDEQQWQEWFTKINSKKAELFLNQVETDCKEGVFRLMKIDNPNKLKTLAELAEMENFDEIINRGKEAIITEKNKKNDFEFKKTLGEYVEEYIKMQLEKQLYSGDSEVNIKVENEQGGQDLIVYKNGCPVYYIEIKSRWNSDQSVMMSPLQMSNSVVQSANYALCCVNMVDFGSGDLLEKHIYPPLEDVIERIKCLTNIGKLNEKLIDSVSLTANINNVHIGGDYKCIIPQSVINSEGVLFSQMLSDILAILR